MTGRAYMGQRVVIARHQSLCTNERLCLDDAVPPNIMDEDSTTSAVAVRENQNISLVCKAEGFPTPKIMWRREDGNPITIDRKKKGIAISSSVINLQIVTETT